MRLFYVCFLGLIFWLAAGAPAWGQASRLPADSVPSKAYHYSERLPIFPGGDSTDTRASFGRFKRFLEDSLQLPPLALRDRVRGQVFLSFAVTAAGRTTDLKIAKGLRADVDSAVLRHAQRLRRVRWQPGTQQGQPVRVAFSVPLSFNLPPGGLAPDSLDLPRFNKLRLPLAAWSLGRASLPAGKGIVYGTCLQRLGFSSGGLPQYVRVINLSTGQPFRLGVKPAVRSRRENTFCYALPAGRYALSEYEFGQFERLARPAAGPGPTVAATRYVFTVVPGQLHYVGTWNLANAHEPLFLDEKTALDATLQADFPAVDFGAARVAIPR
jgi:TonB family protein